MGLSIASPRFASMGAVTKSSSMGAALRNNRLAWRLSSVKHYIMSTQDLLFIHIPKTGGTSLTAALNRHGGIEWDANFQLSRYWRNRGILTLHHRNPFELNRAGVLSDAYMSTATIFSLVRDPMTRAISLWKNVRDHLGSEVRSLDSFWLDFPDLEEVRLWNAIQHKRKGFELDFFAPQTDFLIDSGGHLDDIKIFKLEELDHLSTFLRSRLGEAVSVPHLNRSRLKDPNVTFANPALKHRIHEIYHNDYRNFGYTR